MPRYVKKMSVFQKILCVTAAVMLFSNALSLFMAVDKLGSIVERQVVDGSLSTLKASQISLQTLIQQAISTVLGLANDAELVELLDIPIAHDNERITRHRKMTSIVYRYANINMDPQPKVVAYTADGDMFTNWDVLSTRQKEQLRQFREEYHARVQTGAVPNNAIAWALEISPFFGTLPQPAYTLRFTLPVMREKEMIGLVTLMLPEDRVKQIIGFANPEAHTTYLMDPSGLVLASTDASAVGGQLPFPFELPRVEAGFYTLNAEQDNAMLCYQDVGKYNWYIVDIMPRAYIRQAANAAAKTLIQGAAVSFGVLLVLSLLLARSITLPLKRVTRLMAKETLEASDMDAADPGNNEVALLEHSYFVMRRRLERLLEETEETSRQKRETEIKALQSQIRPHFLFNTLNAVRCSALNHNTEKAADMVMALTQLLRLTLVKGDELIPLWEEVEALDCYVRILQERHATLFEAEYDIAPEVRDFRVPNLLLQPLVENSIAHGFADMDRGGVVRVSAVRVGDEVVLRVADNGRGFGQRDSGELTGARERDRFSGIGLDNVDRRVKLYYGKARGLTFGQTEDGWTLVEMRLPMQEAGGNV